MSVPPSAVVIVPNTFFEAILAICAVSYLFNYASPLDTAVLKGRKDAATSYEIQRLGDVTIKTSTFLLFSM